MTLDGATDNERDDLYLCAGQEPIGNCREVDRNDDGSATIDELVTAVDDARQGCGDP